MCMCAMALVAMPQQLEANVLKHVRGCFRSSVQKWITEPKCELRPSKMHGFGRCEGMASAKRGVEKLA